MIELKNINKSYKNLHVLKNINLNVNENEIVAIEGSSGAGKTTLLKILIGLYSNDSGSVLFNGHNFGIFSTNCCSSVS